MTADRQALESYVRTARWFGGKGREFSVREVRRAGVLGEPDSAPQVGIELVTLEYGGGDRGDRRDTETYQVPLAYYAEEQERLEHALVGSWDDDELGAVHAYDAVHDREATALWLRAFDAGATVGDLTF